MNDTALNRIRWIAANTFTEAIRQKFFAFVIILGAALAASGTALRSFNFGQSELKFIADAGFGAVFFFGSILAVVMTVQLFFSELDNRTALTLLAKPVRRWEFIFGKFAGIWLLLGVFVALIGAILALMLALRTAEISAHLREGEPVPFMSLGGLAVFCVLQWIRLGVVAAVSLVIGALAQTFLYAVIVSTLAVLVCQMQTIASAAFSKTAQTAWMRAIANGVSRMIPDLQMFDLGVPLVLGNTPMALPALSAAGYGLLYIPILLLIAVFLFADREI